MSDLEKSKKRTKRQNVSEGVKQKRKLYKVQVKSQTKNHLNEITQQLLNLTRTNYTLQLQIYAMEAELRLLRVSSVSFPPPLLPPPLPEIPLIDNTTMLGTTDGKIEDVDIARWLMEGQDSSLLAVSSSTCQ